MDFFSFLVQLELINRVFKCFCYEFLREQKEFKGGKYYNIIKWQEENQKKVLQKENQ